MCGRTACGRRWELGCGVRVRAGVLSGVSGPGRQCWDTAVIRGPQGPLLPPWRWACEGNDRETSGTSRGSLHLMVVVNSRDFWNLLGCWLSARGGPAELGAVGWMLVGQSHRAARAALSSPLNPRAGSLPLTQPSGTSESRSSHQDMVSAPSMCKPAGGGGAGSWPPMSVSPRSHVVVLSRSPSDTSLSEPLRQVRQLDRHQSTRPTDGREARLQRHLVNSGTWENIEISVP